MSANNSFIESHNNGELGGERGAGGSAVTGLCNRRKKERKKKKWRRMNSFGLQLSAVDELRRTMLCENSATLIMSGNRIISLVPAHAVHE